jgi:putative transposase
MYAGLRVKIDNNYISLSKAKGSSYSKDDHRIKFKKHKTNNVLPKKVTGYTIEKDNLGNYWITITFKIEVSNFKITKGKQAGIDLGLKKLVTTSGGTTIENHNLTKKNARKLKLEQRKLSRKKKGSKNGGKQRKKVGKVHTKIQNCRKDYNHKVSSKLVNMYDFIGIETLNVKGMMKNKRLSKAIADAAWVSLVFYLDYKANEKQVSLVKIDTWFPSSKTCNVCGSVKDTLELSERIYNCECGYSEDRDINAAKNILYEALRLARVE